MGTIKNQLSEVMGRHRVSQRQLAERAGVRPATIGALYREQSKGVDFATLAGILQALHDLTGKRYDVGDVLTYAPEAEPAPDPLTDAELASWDAASATDLAADLADLEAGEDPAAVRDWVAAFERVAK